MNLAKNPRPNNRLNLCPSRNGRAPSGALANLVEIKAREKFNRRHRVDIPRIKFFAQRLYRANWPFMDGHKLGLVNVRIQILPIERQNMSSQLPIFAPSEPAHRIGQCVNNSLQGSRKSSFQMPTS